MRRREIIRFLATAAAGFCGKRILPAAPVAPVFQDARAVEPLLPLFPLPLVLFPEIDLALHIFEERYKQMIRECLLQRREFGVVLMRDRGFETAGCTAAITEILRSYRNGELDILVQGRRRFELGKLNRDKPYLRGEATFFEDDVTEPPPESLRRHAIEHYDRLVALLQADEPSLRPPALSLEERMLSFRIITAIPADHQTRQRLLTLRSERDRLV
ncbi:MAG TPA: LON peptidase substrate-binding domain-containing protein, partial [Terriglobia bacterium]|nr:LON peptidase substrate-binding domain-containing protein [Terriglobia bacterium]